MLNLDRERLRRASPHVWLAAIVGVAFAAVALLSLGAPGPRIFPDELIYMDAAASVADGDGLSVRGEDYGYGPLYPFLVAPLVALSDRETAFVLAQLLNALAIALVAVPAFLLARRVASNGWSLVAAALSVAVPSSVYASGVLTESVGYLAFAIALLLAVRVVEEPTAGRQVAVLAAVVVAASIRTQFVLLAAVLAATIVLALLLLPSDRRPSTRRYWPIAAVYAAGLLVVAGLLLGGRSPSDLLGDYGVLWSSFDVADVLRSLRDHAALLALYVAVVPVVVAPVEFGRWLEESRAGSRRHAALFSLFAATNLAVLLVVAVFAVNENVTGFLHDRSLFYVAPLWFAVLVGWLGSGLRRPAILLGIGSAVALVLVAALPYHYVRAILWEMLALEPWQFVERGNPTGAPFSGREAMMGFVVVAVCAAVFVPRASRWVIVALVGASLTFTASLAWAHAREGARSIDAAAFAPGEPRGWVDAALPNGAHALLLSVRSACRQEIHLSASRLTEFFNDGIGPGAYVGARDTLSPRAEVAVWRAGALVSADTGKPLVADYVVVRDGVDLAGARLATGTRVPLVLWEVNGPVRLTRPPRSLACAAA